MFAEVDGHAGSAAGSACAARPPYRDDAPVGDVSLVRSPLVDETKEWLSARALTLGNMLASERAVEYVAILRALARFRAEHEPEPLHEDVERKSCVRLPGSVRNTNRSPCMRTWSGKFAAKTPRRPHLRHSRVISTS